MTSTTEAKTPREFGWVLLELMGHRQRVGMAREEEVAGGLMLRIDIPVGEDRSEEYATEYYGASSIYALRPISEEVARDHYGHTDPRPPRPVTYRPQMQLECSEEDEDDLDF